MPLPRPPFCRLSWDLQVPLVPSVGSKEMSLPGGATHRPPHTKGEAMDLVGAVCHLGNGGLWMGLTSSPCPWSPAESGGGSESGQGVLSATSSVFPLTT